MTEDEAKTRWCPFVRNVIDSADYAAGNRFDTSSESLQQMTRCIGSGCMAWRWTLEPRTETHGSGLTEDFIGGGYCGLAGKP